MIQNDISWYFGSFLRVLNFGGRGANFSVPPCTFLSMMSSSSCNTLKKISHSLITCNACIWIWNFLLWSFASEVYIGLSHLLLLKNDKFQIYRYIRNSIFLVEFSGNIGRNGFLTSMCLFYFSSPYSGHLRSDFVVLLLLLTARSRRTGKGDQKCPEKQDK